MDGRQAIREDRLQQRLLSLAVSLFALSAVCLTGCQSSTGMFSLRDKPSSKLVRTSIDETTPGADSSDRKTRQSSKPTVLKEETTADYGALQSRFEGSSAPRTVQKPGHAFLQPRARLGRPVPLPQQVATPSLSDTDSSAVDEASHDVQQRIPAAPKQNVEPVDVSKGSGADTGMQVKNGSQPGTSPWGSGTQSWKPMKQTGDEVTEDSASPSPSNAPGSKWGWPVSKQNVPPASGEVSGSPEASPDAIPNGAMQPIPSDMVEDGGLSQPGESDPVEPGPEDNSMLGRLRSFYPPRLDAGTDRIRKQFRRFPDPFGILKERETNEPGSETAELPLPANSVTADSSTEPDVSDMGAVASENASPSTPIEAAIQQAEQELAAWPRTGTGQPERVDEWRKRQTDLRLLQMIAGRSAESIRMIESLPVDEQEYWQAMMLSMNQFRDIDPVTSRREDLTETLNHLRTAGRRLQPLAALEIQRLMFCSRIDGFGRVAQFPTADFEPGQRILLYAGLRNFRSELTAEGKFRTEFSAEIEFRRAGDDESIETIRLPQILDECDEERTDYYQSFELTAPALEGDYIVRITLQDLQSRQTATSELELSIH